MSSAASMGEFTSRVFVRFKDGRERTDIIHGDTYIEARHDAYTHAATLRERPDIENAFRLDDDE